MPEGSGVSLDEALADNTSLGTYQDQPVLRTAVKLTKAGDGLSKALRLDPELLPIGSTGTLLVSYEVVGHTHKPIDDTECFELVQTLAATTVTKFESKGADLALERQRRKIEEASMRANNVRPLSDGDPGFNPDGDLDCRDEWHEQGVGRDSECPSCGADDG